MSFLWRELLWLMLALPLTDEAGFVLALVLVGQHWWRMRRRPMAGAV